MPRKPKQPADTELTTLKVKSAKGGTVTAYCVKCKQKRVKIADATLTWTWMSAQGAYRPRVVGEHTKCGTQLTTFVGAEVADELVEANS